MLSPETLQGQVAVSLKALQEDPFVRFADRLGEVVAGRVTKLVPFGVFVRVDEGVEGLLPLSDLSDKPVQSPDEIVQVGQPVMVTIAEVDRQHRRVRLTPVRGS